MKVKSQKNLQEFRGVTPPISLLFSLLKKKEPRGVLVLIFSVLFSGISAQQNYNVIVTTRANPPVEPVIKQYINSGRVSVTVRNTTSYTLDVSMRGSIERISPSPFTINLSGNYFSSYFTLNPNTSINLTTQQMLDAFGNFIESNLVPIGVNLASLRDANNQIKLPEGVYRICFSADNDGPISAPGTGCATFTIAAAQPANAVVINTRLIPPASPDIVKYINGGNVKPTLTYNNPQGTTQHVKVYGKIQSLAPNSFSISLNPGYFQQQLITLAPGVPFQLSPQMVADAFGNFNEANLVTSGINIQDLKDKNNIIKLPEGSYRLCFYARYDSAGRQGGYASNVNLGCANFDICYKASPPQVTQPVTNFNIGDNTPTIKATSPVIFAWTPINATCGLNLNKVTYDFEMREMFASQTITDAINNPIVYQKSSLRSTTLIFDTLLNKQILVQGKIYVIRVKANTQINSAVEIDNNGYSRVLAFVYGDTSSVVNSTTPIVKAPKQVDSSIPTSVIKGKVVWSFKKSEEEMPVHIENNITKVINAKKSPTLIFETSSTPQSQGRSVNVEEKMIQKALWIDPNFQFEKGANYKIKSTAKPSYDVVDVVASVITDGEVLEKENLRLPAQKGKDTHPLKGARVFLMGVKNKDATSINSSDFKIGLVSESLAKKLGVVTTPPPTKEKSKQPSQVAIAQMYSSVIQQTLLMSSEKDQDEDVIGSGTSDSEGNFVINFIDPKYKNVNQYSKMRLVVEHLDFENFSQSINVVSPDENGDMDLGTVQVLAKTYRFTPRIVDAKLNVNKVVPLFRPEKIELYCPTDLLTANPHYAFMGKKGTDRIKRTIAGREYTLIADFVDGETINKLFYQRGYSDFVLRIYEEGFEDQFSYLGVRPKLYTLLGDSGFGGMPITIDESSMVISVKVKFESKKILPFIYGQVKISLGDKGITFADNALVTVSYDGKKIVEGFSNNELKPQKKDQKVILADGKKVSITKSGYEGAIKGVSKKDPGNNYFIESAVKDLENLLLYRTVTDSMGNYRIDNLPILEEGEFFTVKVHTKEKLDSFIMTPRTLYRGESYEVGFQFNPEIFTFTGIVVDENGDALGNAILKWKGGGDPIEADENGLFVASNYKDDSITISRIAYKSKTIFLKAKRKDKLSETQVKVLKKAAKLNIIPPEKLESYSSLDIQAWRKKILVQPSVIERFKNNSSSETSSAWAMKFVLELFQTLPMPVTAVDVGKVGYLVKGSANINFIVTDAASNTPIENAVVRIGELVDTFTGNNGMVLYKGGGSSFTYTVEGPAGSDYVSVSGQVGEKDVDGSTTDLSVQLTKGIKLSGFVMFGGKGLDGADVYVDGRSFIKTQSKNDGSYVLNVPQGEFTIQAIKTNYVGDKVVKNFSASTTHDFNLKDGGGKNISKLLGFDIVLEKSSGSGASQVWTGFFVNLKTNNIFSTSSATKLKFSNVNVTFDTEGNAIVDKNEVKTDETEMAMKAFGFIPLKMKGSPQITVRKNQENKGTIGGKLQLDLSQISSVGGLIFDKTIKPYLLPLSSSIDQDVPIFISDGNINISDLVFSFAREELKQAADKAVKELKEKADNAMGEAKTALLNKLGELQSAASTASGFVSGNGNIPNSLPQYASVKIYGYEAAIDLAKCKIDASGLTMNGFLITPPIPVISTLLFEVERLKISPDFVIKDVSIKATATLKFDIASWKGEINAVAFNLNGFKLDGKIAVAVPKSLESTLAFSNLSVGSSGLYGGSFSIPSAGINVFDIISLKSGSLPLSFGRVGNTSVYKLGGSASFSFPKLFSDKINIPYFQIQTDGKFAVTVPVNKSINTGFAKFALNNITFNTTTSVPQIDIDGMFSTDVKLISFSSGGIHFKTSGVTVDRVKVGLDIPAVTVEAYVDIRENGFAGGGSLSILNTPVKASIDFFYFKKPLGIELGASFSADVKIPIGPVIISRVGGGFAYHSNPEYFSVTIEGGASVTGLETLIALDPIKITVESGPKITGTVGIKVATAFELATATIVIDIPKMYFSVGISSEIEPVPDMVRAHIQGDLVVSTKPGDTFFFLGCGMDVNLLGLINSRGVYALGFGVNNAQTRETISYYLESAPSGYLTNGSFSGIYISAMTEMGVRERDAPTLDLIVVDGKLWLYSRSEFSIIINFDNANFRISSSMIFEGGISASVVAIHGSASAKACVYIEGGFNNSDGWNFAASASGEAILSVGVDCGCNETCLIGGKICVGAGARIRFASRRGGLQELSMYIGNRARCN